MFFEPHLLLKTAKSNFSRLLNNERGKIDFKQKDTLAVAVDKNIVENKNTVEIPCISTANTNC